MLYTIANDSLRITINDLGAQLWSIQTADGTEYLWQGDPRYWSDRALNLFPQIGLCTNGKYTLHGREYSLAMQPWRGTSPAAISRRWYWAAGRRI